MLAARALLVFFIACAALPAWAADPPAPPNHVTTFKDDGGWKLQVDGHDTFVFGMNWGYVPIGTNYSYDFWSEDEAFIEQALSREMALLRDMGVNAIRLYPGIPNHWVTWIHDNYGIMTMINPLIGRYGFAIDGRFVPNVDYSDPRTRELLKADTLAVIERYKDTPGVMFWLLGNESNYGLSWSSFEIQNLPEGDRDAARARYLYSLYGEITEAIQATDPHHPVAIANGDLQYIDLIAEEMPTLDIMASNVYRGRSARDLYDVVKAKLDLPFVYSEFGADAYDARRDKEDHLTQADVLLDQWEEIYEQSYGHEGAGNAIGGFIFQWTDGWWKYKQEENLDVHDTNASWANRAYPEDYVEDGNNMNEEWFGITAKGRSDPRGQFQVFPRSAYYALQKAFELHPYEASNAEIDAWFEAIRPRDYTARYQADLLSRDVEQLNQAFVANVRVDFDTFTTSSDEANGVGKEALDFDHTESFYLDVASRPVQGLRADLSINVLANVAENPIDEIFWEARGRPAADPDDPDLTVEDSIGSAILERVRVYRAGLEWENRYFKLTGYFRKGHGHWAYDGDYWGLYREAYYGDAIDIYAADTPLGIELQGKDKLDGLRMALAREAYWGANPAVYGLYRRAFGPVTLAVMHQEDIAAQGVTTTSNAIPEQVTRKSTISLNYETGIFKLDVGGLIAGTDRLGRTYRATVEAQGDTSYNDSGYDVIQDTIRFTDTLGAKATVQVVTGPVQWLVEGAYQGLVSDAGIDQRQRFTGWSLRGSGRGNHWHTQAGFMATAGPVTIAPNVLYQRPLVGPINTIADSFDPATGGYFAGVGSRNVRDTPFAVLDNRETLGFELLLTYDPTPGSWLWSWDNEQREDANFAGALDVVYRIQPTTTDANFGFTQDGVLFAFSGAPQAANVWDASARLLFNTGRNVKLISRLYAGQGQSTGDDDRLVTRYGADLRLWWKSIRTEASVKINDWGPYDYYRTFNLTFPFQMGLDFSAGVGKPKPFLPSTRFGIRAKYRTRDQFSPDFVPDVLAPDRLGWEMEIRSYVTVTL